MTRFASTLFFVRALCAVLSLTVLLGSGYAWATYRSFASSVRHVDAIRSGSQGGDGADMNILIVGNDDRETATDSELAQLGTTRDGGSLNTDTMMVLHVPANGAKATLYSFPRDSYVDIPGHGMNKLNAAYPIGVTSSGGDRSGGARLLVQTIEKMIPGLHIDAYAQVDLIGFYRISVALDGIDVCLNAAQQDSYSGIDLPAGHSTVQGRQALAFVRQRHGLLRGDLDRIQRQQYFLAAVFRKLSSNGVLLNPARQRKLLTAVSKSITVDGLDILQFAAQMQNLQPGQFTLSTIPTFGTDDRMIDGQQLNVVLVDTDSLQDAFASITGRNAAAEVARATAAPIGSFTVSVVNGSPYDHVATANADALTRDGFRAVVGQDTVNRYARTTIKYPAGAEGQAKALLAEVPGARVVSSTTVDGVTLVIGANRVQAKSIPKPSPTAASTPSPRASKPAAADPGVRTAADAGCVN